MVPETMFRTLGNTPAAVTDKLKEARVHAVLATNLVLDKAPELDTWSSVLPTKEDFQMLMPFCWPPELQSILPHGCATVLAKQKADFNKDWDVVSAAYGDTINKDDFLYAWLLVNTRTFYYANQSTKNRPKEDHMILQPVADLLNHSAHGCNLCFDRNECTITTVRDHEAGEEIFISYGSHSNDFLLVQYGFTLPSTSNPWDELCLDPYLTPQLITAGQKERLEGAGFWGRYMLDSETPCYRTEVALRSLCLTPSQWQAVLDGERDEDQDRELINKELLRVLERAEEDVAAKLAAIAVSEAGSNVMRTSLKARWQQTGGLVARALATVR